MISAIIERVSYLDIACLESAFRLGDRSQWARFFVLVSRSGNGLLYPLILLVVLFSAPSYGRVFSAAALIGFAIELPVYKIIKSLVKRRRPFEALPGIHSAVVPSDRFSLPSGHTAAAFVMATLLAYLFPLLAIGAYAWASLVGFSRIYLGVHYPSDVLAGMALGLLSAGAGLWCATSGAWILAGLNA